jgi:hypothetical protein
MSFMAQVCGFVLCAFIGLMAATIIVWVWTGKIDLSQLISEPTGDASMSRFQLLIFTFVIAISFFVLVESNHGSLPDIPNGVLTLLGISASTYAVSKGITYSQPQTLTPHSDGDEEEDEGQSAADEAKEAAAAAKAHADRAEQAAQQAAQTPPKPE